MKKLSLLILLSLFVMPGFAQTISILNDSPETINILHVEDELINSGPAFSGTLTEILDQTFDSLTNLSPIRGFTAAMLLEDGTLWKRAAGIAEELPEEVELTTEHLMGMGSITKPFVAATILLMMEDGLLNLDDSIGQYLPTYPNIDGAITIRQALSMRSGINDYLNENPSTVNQWVIYPDSIWDEEVLLNNYVLAPNFEPDDDWSYSNTNYLLAGQVIETISGQTWYEEVRDRIITPLGLTHTFSYPWESPNGQPFSHAWINWDAVPGVDDLQGLGVSMDGFFSMGSSAGCLITTPEDLVRFSDGLYGGDLLQAASLAEMQIDYFQNPGSGLAYGLGTMSLTFPSGVENYGHNGSLIYKSMALHFPEKNVSIAVQQNDNRLSSPNFPLVDVFSVFEGLLDACDSYVPVATTDLNVGEGITIFPNPVSDQMTIQFPENAEVDFPVEAQLMDVNGRVLKLLELSGEMNSLDVSGFSSGVYFLRIGGIFHKIGLN